MIYGLAQHIVKTELFELQLRSIPVIWLFSSMKVARTSFKRLFFCCTCQIITLDSQFGNLK